MAKRWTEQETQYLKDNIGAFPIGIIAKRLNRSETSCVVKAKRVKAGTFSKHTDMFTIKEAAQQVGCDWHAIERLINNGSLIPVCKTIKNKTKRKFLKFDDVMALAKSYQKTNQKKWNEEETNYLITMFYFGKTYREIGEKLGRSESSVKHRMQRIEYRRKLQNVDLYNR